MGMSDLYSFKVNHFIKEKKDYRTKGNIIKASIIIVTYNNTERLINSIESLTKQTVNNFEIIVIDNNEKVNINSIVKNYPIHYIKLNKNYGISLGRNIGIKYAKGDIVIFLDDDATPAKNFVEEHIRAYQLLDIYGLRGKALPINQSNHYNHLCGHYDLGEKILPWYVNLEGNSSFKKDILLSIGGFNTALKGAGGHEGIELTYRIIKKYHDKSKLIYYPKVMIYHDCTDNLLSYTKKLIRHGKNQKMIESQFPDIFNLIEEYHLDKNTTINDSHRVVLKLRIIHKLARMIVKIHAIIFSMRRMKER